MTEHVKIAIVGSGPSGLSAAARAAQLGVSHVLLEAARQPANTIYKYQKGKHVMAEPERAARCAARWASRPAPARPSSATWENGTQAAPVPTVRFASGGEHRSRAARVTVHAWSPSATATSLQAEHVVLGDRRCRATRTASAVPVRTLPFHGPVPAGRPGRVQGRDDHHRRRRRRRPSRTRIALARHNTVHHRQPPKDEFSRGRRRATSTPSRSARMPRPLECYNCCRLRSRAFSRVDTGGDHGKVGAIVASSTPPARHRGAVRPHHRPPRRQAAAQAWWKAGASSVPEQGPGVAARC